MKNLIVLLSLLVLSFSTACQNNLSNDIDPEILEALKTGQLSVIKAYIDKGIDINQQYGDKRYTLLNYAIKGGHLLVVQFLIKQKADITLESNGKTPIMYSAKYGRLEIAKYLVAQGADPKKRNSKGRNAVDYAKRYNQSTLYEYFNFLE